jgi:hypothetical protein
MLVLPLGSRRAAQASPAKLGRRLGDEPMRLPEALIGVPAAGEPKKIRPVRSPFFFPRHPVPCGKGSPSRSEHELLGKREGGPLRPAWPACRPGRRGARQRRPNAHAARVPGPEWAGPLTPPAGGSSPAPPLRLRLLAANLNPRGAQVPVRAVRRRLQEQP